MLRLAMLRSARLRAVRRTLPAAFGAMMLVWSLPAAGLAHDDNGAWHTVGSAKLQNDSLVLTESSTGLAGAAWQVPAGKLPRKFTATFDFALSDPHGAADGFAFVIQGASADALGGAGGGLGYSGIPNSIAVEFDTWMNSASNFGSPTSVADPTVPHISIHTRGPQPNNPDEQYSLGVSTVVPFLSNGTRHSVTVSYKRRTLSVTLDGQPKLSVPINLRESLDLRHRRAWFGFTAATGAATQRQVILAYRLQTGDDCDDSRDCGDAPDMSDNSPSDNDDG